MKRIIAASQNEHKIKEIEAITKEFGMEIISRHDAGIADIDIEEDGVTFEENSYKKTYEIRLPPPPPAGHHLPLRPLPGRRDQLRSEERR